MTSPIQLPALLETHLALAGLTEESNERTLAISSYHGKISDKSVDPTFQHKIRLVHFAALGGQIELIRQIAETNMQSIYHQDERGLSIFSYAKQANQTACMAALLKGKGFQLAHNLCQVFQQPDIDPILTILKQKDLIDLKGSTEEYQNIIKKLPTLQTTEETTTKEQQLQNAITFLARLKSYTTQVLSENSELANMFTIWKQKYTPKHIPLGQGSFASVMLVENIFDEKIYAFKFAIKQQYQSVLDREIQIFEELNARDPLDRYPIARKIDLIEDRLLGLTGLVLRLEDCNLIEHLTKNRCDYFNSLPFLQKIGKQLLEGAAFLQGNLLIHADLKPENILMKQGSIDQIVITDFGLSFYSNRKLPVWALHPYHIQTSYYRAPECLIHTDDLSHAVDMWSIGCIIAEIVIKTPLFNHTDHELSQLEQKHISLLGPYPEEIEQKRRTLRPQGPIRPTPFPITREPLKDLITRMVDLNPGLRISATQALNHPFFSKVGDWTCS